VISWIQFRNGVFLITGILMFSRIRAFALLAVPMLAATIALACLPAGRTMQATATHPTRATSGRVVGQGACGAPVADCAFG
jgi:hypothetical protein